MKTSGKRKKAVKTDHARGTGSLGRKKTVPRAIAPTTTSTAITLRCYCELVTVLGLARRQLVVVPGL